MCLCCVLSASANISSDGHVCSFHLVHVEWWSVVFCQEHRHARLLAVPPLLAQAWWVPRHDWLCCWLSQSKLSSWRSPWCGTYILALLSALCLAIHSRSLSSWKARIRNPPGFSSSKNKTMTLYSHSGTQLRGKKCWSLVRKRTNKKTST